MATAKKLPSGSWRCLVFSHYENLFSEDGSPMIEYYGAAEPPVRCGESHLSGLTEPPHFIY